MSHEGPAPKDIQRIMGHTSLDMTMETYNHSTEKRRKKLKIKSILLFRETKKHPRGYLNISYSVRILYRN